MQIISERMVMGDGALFFCNILLLLGIGALIALIDALIVGVDIGVKRLFAVILAISVIAMLMVIKYSDKHMEYEATLTGTVDMDEVTNRYTIIEYQDGIWVMVPKEMR